MEKVLRLLPIMLCIKALRLVDLAVFWIQSWLGTDRTDPCSARGATPHPQQHHSQSPRHPPGGHINGKYELIIIINQILRTIKIKWRF